MIETMKKVSLVILDQERRQSLKQLRKLGLVHLEELEGKGEELAKYRENFSKTEKALSILDEIKLNKKERKIIQAELRGEDKVLSVSERIIALSDRKKSLLDSILANTNELERFTMWGNVNPADFAAIAEKGIFLYMYEIPSDKYALLPESLNTIVVNQSKNITRFILFSFEQLTERPKNMLPEAYAVPLPQYSTDEIVKSVEKAKKEIAGIEDELKKLCGYKKALSDSQIALKKNILFETVYSGMEHEDKGEEKDSYLKNNSLAWLTGYVPLDSLEEFKKACVENKWAYLIEDPKEDDAVPTKLKNNKFVSLIYPLTDFLGTVPGYHEFDISGWFLFFFTIFFGMIFGDGGYGVIVTLAAIVLILKNLFTKKPFAPMHGLMLILGLATVIWGLVTCTWFGVSADTLRKIGLGFLPDLSVPALSNAYTEIVPGVPRYFRLPWSAPGEGLTTTQCLQVFCFALALMQLSIAHIKCIVRNRKSLKVLGDIGSLMQIIGMFWVVLMVVISMKEFPMDAVKIFGIIPIGYVFVTMLAIGFVMSFIFSNYSGSVKDSVLESCKNIISVLLGIVNVFSDILSYVRLWAVGLAGSAISSTVNGMAVQIFGIETGNIVAHFIIFVMVVVLIVFGHGLNIILNLLSVIVHGVRLNTLEFSNHLGMEWSGFKYEPFSEK